MTWNEPIEEQLARALAAQEAGGIAHDLLSRANGDRDELLSLLNVAEELRADARRLVVPIPERLHTDTFTIRAAVRRANRGQQREGGGVPWWRRRIAVATLSMPAGLAAAFLLAGAGGATAAATMAVVGPERAISAVVDAPAAVTRAVTHAPVIGEDSNDGQERADSGATVPGQVNTPGAAAIGEHTPGAAATAAATMVQPQDIELDGSVSGVENGNSFVLTTSDGDYHVTTDENTVISGELADGASAHVAGRMTGGRSVHATDVTVAGGAPLAPTATDTPKDQNTPGPPATHTPPPTKTPAPDPTERPTKTPSPRTPGPPADRTPPGQDGGGGGAGTNGGGPNP